MINTSVHGKGSARPRVEAKRPPMGADGRCPAFGQAKGFTCPRGKKLGDIT